MTAFTSSPATPSKRSGQSARADEAGDRYFTSCSCRFVTYVVTTLRSPLTSATAGRRVVPAPLVIGFQSSQAPLANVVWYVDDGNVPLPTSKRSRPVNPAAGAVLQGRDRKSVV